MPELPEVESARSLVEAHCLGAKVLRVDFNEDGTFDEKIFAGTTEKDFRKALVGRTVAASKRRGKHMWWELSGSSGSTSSSSPLFHFGMTGAMTIKGKGAMKYKAFAVDVDSWPPRFAKLVVTFSNGIALAYTDPRRFGRVRLVAGDVEASPPISELGFDPLTDMPDETTFAAHFTPRAAPVKAVLLNQKVAAGVGNWIADEVLYQAAIHPEQPANSLTHAQLCRMRDAMSTVVTLACEAGADADKFPAEWLFHHRWGKVAGEVSGRAISFITVGGRTTAFVPQVQKKPKKKTTNAVAASAAAVGRSVGGGKGRGRGSGSGGSMNGRRKRGAASLSADSDLEEEPKKKAHAAAAAAPRKITAEQKTKAPVAAPPTKMPKKRTKK